MLSRVVPATSVTMLRSSPRRALMKLDLPALGWPTMAIWGMVEGSSSLFSTYSTVASSNSPVPLPVTELRKKVSSKPRLQNSLASSCRAWLSTLLTARMTGFLLLRNMRATCSSRSVMPVETSTMKRITLASSMAISTWSRMAASKTSSLPRTKPPVSTTANSLPFQWL